MSRTTRVLATIVALALAVTGVTVTAAQAKTHHVDKSATKKKRKKKTTVVVKCAATTVTCVGKPGPQGIQGPPGANGVNGTNGTNGTNGANGTALAFARIKGSDLTVSASKNFSAANIVRSGTDLGNYCIGGLSFTPRNIQMTQAADVGSIDFTPYSLNGVLGNPFGECPAGFQQAQIVLYNTAGTDRRDGTFFLELN